MKVLRHQDFITKRWSGGMTTELMIYPSGSSYVSRDFLFRLSRATIEVEQSVFTKLEGVTRRLMVTKGELKLIHDRHHNRTLTPFQSDHFSGDWETKSIGKAEDFNLMLMGATAGYLDSIQTTKSAVKQMDSDCDFFAVNCIDGSATIDDVTISQNDLIVMENPDLTTTVEINSETSLIFIRIWLNR